MNFRFLKISRTIETGKEWLQRLRHHLYNYEKTEERLLQEKAWIDAELKAARKNKLACLQEIQNTENEQEALNQEICELKKNTHTHDTARKHSGLG